MRIVLGCDHAAADMKEFIKIYLTSRGFEVQDVSGGDTNYPAVAERAANLIKDGDYPRGILICGTGAGMSIAANKVKGIRAVACSETFTARMAKEHNNANIICFGARVVDNDMAKAISEAWLDAEFQGGRHAERVGMIEKLENGR